ncbi:hypothetical protein FBUS_08451 [Fasciolopsis buskii]|uniref:Uncharacterized protein n=1 Tax=Fasciolopsis buskii TaxID=27845 RepID=A0A8E0RZ08_9TREM|nr:hypothetical protein FBUS_08451 [Fasciolopsis buski]
MNREESDRNLISLVTVIVYFPVSQMSSANSLCYRKPAERCSSSKAPSRVLSPRQVSTQPSSWNPAFEIKLKIRLAETNDLEGVIVKRNLFPPNLVQQTTGEDGISWCIVSPGQHKESVGWYIAFHLHSVDEPRVSTNILNSHV